MSYTVTIGATTINTTNTTKPYVLAKSLDISLGADNRNNCSLTIVTTANIYLPNTGGDLVVVDGAETIFGGIIKTSPRSRPGIGTGADTTIFVDVWSDGYSSIPSRRTITTAYTAQTSGFIVNDLITSYLSAEGVTAGTINAGMTQPTYERAARSIKDILDELAGMSGFKWYIDNDKALHFLQDDAIVEAAHDIIEGSAYTEYRDVTVEENLGLYRNKQHILGGTLLDGSVYEYSKQLDSEIAARIVIEGGGSGIYDNSYSDPFIITNADAEDAADNLLKKYSTVPTELRFNSDDTDWRAGTSMQVVLPTFGIAGITHESTPVGYNEVATAADLYNVRNDLTANYIQTADIDLNVAPYNTGDGWLPIGDYVNNFTGIYNGNGYKISNLFINRATTYNGLFGYTADIALPPISPELINICLENVNVTGGVSVGQSFCAGLVGSARKTVIKRCSVSGAVTATGDGVGLLAGYANWPAQGGISECFTEGTVEGTVYVGGLIGILWAHDVGTPAYLDNCYSRATASGTNDCGGLIGRVYVTITGGPNDSFAEVDNCYSMGAVIKVSGVGTRFGGLIGGISAGGGVTITSCYYDTDTSGRSDDDGRGTPKTTVEMKTQSTFTSWDFTNIWGIVTSINNGYPYFLWYGEGEESPYFLIEEVTIRDLGAGHLRSYVTATKRRRSSPISTQRSERWLDYFANWRRQEKNTLIVAQSVESAVLDKADNPHDNTQHSATYLTTAVTALNTLINAVTLAGAGGLSVSVVGQTITLDATDVPGKYYEPLTDGDEDTPEILFSGGDILMGEVI